MSHFAVAVITDVEPTDELLRAVLQPWHEYECTGVEDEYVVAVDITEDWDRECYPTISEFAEDYGGTVVGERVTRKTNPNAKWDWWQVGGRYSNRLAVRGEECDSAMVAELDWDAMRRSVTETRRRWVAECEKESGLHGDELERGIREKTEGNAAWMALTEPKPRGHEYLQWLADNGYPLGAKAANCFELPPLKPEQSLTEWVESPPALSAFAYVKDGEWHQKGRMGWWAIVTDEQEGYEQEFQEMLQLLKPNQWITIVDCHI